MGGIGGNMTLRGFFRNLEGLADYSRTVESIVQNLFSPCSTNDLWTREIENWILPSLEERGKTKGSDIKRVQSHQRANYKCHTLGLRLGGDYTAAKGDIQV